ncbi:MAG: LPS translocon maturation chaperone LptM [Burkholderiales bacterium]
MFRSAALVLALLILAGCGTKGPLYLPTPEQIQAADKSKVDNAPRNNTPRQ